MKRCNIIPYFLFAIIFFATDLSYAQSIVAQKKSSATASADPQEQIKRLYSQDPIERAWGAYYLGEMGEGASSAIPNLISILDDDISLKWVAGPRDNSTGSPTSVGGESAKALIKIGQVTAKPLIAAFNTANKAARKNIISALSYAGKKSSPFLELLIIALKDGEHFIREDAARAIGLIGDTSAIEPLIAAFLNENDCYCRRAQIGALDTLDPSWSSRKEVKESVSRFISILQDKEQAEWDRYDAASMLGRIKDPSALKALIEALKDGSQTVRHNAAIALGEIKNPQAVEPLIAVLKDKSEYSRGKTYDAVSGKFKESKDKNEYTRQEAARALGQIGDARAVDSLIAAFSDEDEGVRLSVEGALKMVTGQDLGDNSAKWQEWWQANKGKFGKEK